MIQPSPRRMSGLGRALRNTCLNLMKCLLIAAQLGIFTVMWFQVYRSNIRHPYWDMGNWAVIGVFMVFYVLFAHLYGGFHIKTSRATQLLYSLFIGSVFSTALCYCVLCLLNYEITNPLPLLTAWGAELLVFLIWAPLAALVNDLLFPPEHTYVIYNKEDSYVSIAGLQQLTWKFSVEGILKLSDDLENLDEVLASIRGAEAVFLCGLSSSVRNTILKFCIEADIHAYIQPNIGDILISGASHLQLMNIPVLHCCRNKTSLWYRIISRTMDVVISGVALILFSPVMLITGLVIHLYDGGPAFYKQGRPTGGGKEFKILKFRSMRTDAEKDGVARLATEHDDRITPVGHFIRKCRLDELPQLINILKGDMAIVGPRPERPEIAAQYERQMPEFHLRLQVKAGLTGYAQVYGKYNTRPYDKLEMDLLYIANQSILQDLRLMFATVKILFQSESTEGVAEGTTTAGKENIPV